MSRSFEISVTVAGLQALFPGDLRRVVETARVADACGIDRIELPDHLAIGPHPEAYPYGRYPLPADEPFLEPLATLAAMAPVTSRIRLATGVLVAPPRPALLLAKTAATVDVLSGGRLDLGVGLGWQREEIEACGVPFAGRGARLDDTLRACRALWRDAPASFASDTVSFHELWCEPRPVQPEIPIWLGGPASGRNLARIVELGAGWAPMPCAPDVLAADVERLRQACREAGRNPDSVGVRAAATERDPAAARALAAAGATCVSFALGRFTRSRDEIPSFFEGLVRDFG